MPGAEADPQDLGKKIVNLVYFDAGFVNAGGQPLFMQVDESCVHPEGRY